MINIKKVLKSNRLIRALTGLKRTHFLMLVYTFAAILKEEQINSNHERERAFGGGRNHTLSTAEEKLFFILFYLKCYPTQDLAAFIFDVNRSQICRWVQILLPILEKTLNKKLVLPTRKIKSEEEFYELFPEIGEVYIDGTERSTQRSKNYDNQKEDYSGKKKDHTKKNIIISDNNKKILFLGSTKGGRNHDYSMLKDESLVEHIPKDVGINVDLGFMGIEKDYKRKVKIPHKKPKNKELTLIQKEENKKLSSERVIVENSICGVKRLKCLMDTYRNKKKDFEDKFMLIGCGLWNYYLEAA